MGEARDLARRIMREQEKMDAERKKDIRNLGLMAVTFIVAGSLMATAGLATGYIALTIPGGLMVLFGLTCGVFWAVTDK